MKRLLPLLTVAAIVAVAIAATVGHQTAGALGPTAAWRHETLALHAVNVVDKGYPVGPKDQQVGDREVVSYDLAVHGRRVGRAGYQCSRTTPHDLVCAASVRLPGGLIALAADITGAPVTTTAITGGTGRYRGASGTTTNDFRHSTITVHLLLPDA